MATMSISTMVALHVIYSWPDGTILKELHSLAKKGKVGGIIIFGENVNDNLPSQIAHLQNVYKQSPGYCGQPLLITTDQ